MKTVPLNPDDLLLVEEAKQKISNLYEENKHHVGAALRTSTGKIISGVHLEAYIGRVAICAEAITIGSLISSGEKEFTTIVAVLHPSSDEQDKEVKVVSPCGICRELIADYSPKCMVIIDEGSSLIKVPIQSLLPFKYSRED